MAERDAGNVGRAVLRSLAGVRAAPGWHPLGMGLGDAGMAVAFGALHEDDPDGGWDTVAHEYLGRMVAGLRRGGGPDASLFGGTAAAAFAVRSLAGQGRYAGALATVDGVLIERVRGLLAGLPDAGGLAVPDYDLVSGLTGVAAYLLGVPDDPAAELLADILGRFVAWSADGFWTPQARVLPTDAPELAGGYCNLGLAHGIAGPLAVLALAERHGRGVPGGRDAAARIVARLRAGMVGPRLASYLLPDGTPFGAAMAWCYGNPGVARAVQLAGLAFGEPDWDELAWSLITGVLDGSAGRESPILCHGTAGLAYLLHRMHADATWPADRRDRCARLADDLLAELVAGYDTAARHGFHTPEPDHPGLLIGATGIGLVLLAVHRGAAPWERLLLAG